MRETRGRDGQRERENSIPRSIMQPVCRITAGTRFRFAPMKGLPRVYSTSARARTGATRGRACTRSMVCITRDRQCVAHAVYTHILYNVDRASLSMRDRADRVMSVATIKSILQQGNFVTVKLADKSRAFTRGESIYIYSRYDYIYKNKLNLYRI